MEKELKSQNCVNEKFVNVKIDRFIHKKLKIKSFEEGVSLKKLLNDLLNTLIILKN